MSAPNLQARRATVDDLAALRSLWQSNDLPVAALEKQLKDFQVMEGENGALLGALALHAEAQQGWMHSEAYVQSAPQEELRQLLWERAKIVARNYGMHCVWTTEGAPFWRSTGFEPATPESMKKLPPGFGAAAGSWLVLKLRETTAASVSLEHEFDLFTQAQRENSERLMRQAQGFRNVAYVLLGVVVVLGLVLAVFSMLPQAGRSRSLKAKTAPIPAGEVGGTATNEVPRQPGVAR